MMDPVEDRDIEKLIAMLEDERVIRKLIEILGIKKKPNSGPQW